MLLPAVYCGGLTNLAQEQRELRLLAAERRLIKVGRSSSGQHVLGKSCSC
jgi:hypothetical protein